MGLFVQHSDANLPLFGEIRRFFDQMGHFCKSPKTDEKNGGLLGYGGLATVNARSLFKGKISFAFATTELRFMKTSLFFRSHYFIENLQLKRKSAEEQRKKKRIEV